MHQCLRGELLQLIKHKERQRRHIEPTETTENKNIFSCPSFRVAFRRHDGGYLGIWPGSLAAALLGLPKVPVLFGCLIIFKKPFLVPSACLYTLLIYLLPITVTACLSASMANKISEKLLRFPIYVSVILHTSMLLSRLARMGQYERLPGYHA